MSEEALRILQNIILAYSPTAREARELISQLVVVDWTDLVTQRQMEIEDSQRVCLACKRLYVPHPVDGLEDMCQQCRQKWQSERDRVSLHRSLARKMNLADTLTVNEWRETIAHFNAVCAYCNTRPYQVLEHFVPMGLGGGTTQRNCVPACSTCNNLKKDKHPDNVTNIPKEAIERVRTYLLEIGKEKA